VERDSIGSDKPLDGVPRSPSGRVPQWVVDEATAVVTHPAEPWPSDHSYPSADIAGQHRDLGRRRGVKGLAVLLILVLGAAWLTMRPGESYRFMRTQADGKTPVAYSQCAPIRYVVQRHGEPAGGGEAITAAVARVSQATGLPFVYGGATSEGFSRQRPAYQPNNYGDRWAPVLIAWVTRIQDPDLGADALGAGGSASVEVPNGQRAYVTGDMELNAEKLARILEQPNGKQVVQAVVMHELGHIMGLAHVNSRSQLMYPRNQSGVTDFGAGDLTGLAALGKGTCSSYR
jgi:hypothetical protein